LGAPGAGKTTLLLTLASDLLIRAAQDPEHPIPVIFPLSSWARQQRPLAAWLVDALNEQYDVPRETGQAWVDADQVLPLLDGLDEVAAEHRAACVEAANTFRQEHGLLPLVVCSRVTDYEGLDRRLRLQGAIVVQPLTREQVDSYLAQIGQPVAAVREALHNDPTLWELLDTPLMLTVTTLAYAGASVEVLRTQGTLVERRQHLFATYVDRMFQRRGAITNYTRQQTERWLTWLAWQMTQHSQTVFYLERMQPDWLPQEQCWVPRQGMRLMAGLVGGAPIVLAVGLLVGWLAGLKVGVGTGLLAGLFAGLVAGQAGYSEGITLIETVRWSWSRFLAELLVPSRRRLRAGLGIGVLFGLIFGVIFLLSGLGGELEAGLGGGLKVGLGAGLGGGLGAGFGITLIAWLGIVLVFGILFVLLLFAGLLVGLKAWLGAGLGGGLEAGLGGGLFIGLLAGLLYKLSAGFAAGLSSSEIATTTTPNEGIHRSARVAMISGLGSGLGSGLFIGLLSVGLLAALGIGLSATLGIGLGVALFVGGTTGIRYGGRTCLQHLLLRRGLRDNDFAPWHYVDFLDYAAERIFLRKVGGGYKFYHGLLQEYFSSLDLESGTVQIPRYVRRHPWTAGSLSCIIPGIGQIYNGQPAKGFFVYGLWWGGSLAALMIMLELPMPSWNVVIPALMAGSGYGYALLDAVLTARRQDHAYHMKAYNKRYVYLLPLFLVGAAVIATPMLFTIHTYVTRAYKIPSGSLEDTLLVGDHILVKKYAYWRQDPARGDIVIFPFPRDPSRDFIKRVIGLPGDRVEVRNHRAYVNGKLLNEPYVKLDERATLYPSRYSHWGPEVVPPGQLFMLGDNRDNSVDSRDWGFVDSAQVKGRACLIYWSWDRSVPLVEGIRWGRIGKALCSEPIGPPVADGRK
jgi:signal peptidase I